MMKKIVIIEDDLALRENTMEFLQEEGYSAHAACDGAAGVQLVLDIMPDLILCDINMPVMDGFEVLKTLQSITATLSIPFIFMTAKAQKEEIRYGMQHGVDDYITKPFSLDELLATIKVRIAKYEKVLNTYENKYLNLVANANKQLEKSNKEILRLDKVKLDFLNMISQELRNPIERIKDPIKLLKYKVENKNMAELIEIIDESVMQLDKFSLQALEITQLKTDPHLLNNTKVLVSGLLEYALLSIQKNHIEKKICINMKIQENLFVLGDSTLLVKCFANILDNACKFSKNNGVVEISAVEKRCIKQFDTLPTGRQELTVSPDEMRCIEQFDKLTVSPVEIRCIEPVEMKNNIVIEISDQGIGIDKITLNNLSKMLASDEQNLKLNSGMGLFHSKLLAEAHGGVIQICSAENSGTKVILFFH